jgi:alpha-beta hydrolase superfamily lysophospholipase
MPSSGGFAQIAGSIYTSSDVKPFCVLQISHGMKEHFARYDDFSRFLCRHGIAVCGSDHIGHGRTSPKAEDKGYFGEKGSHHIPVQDLKLVNDYIHKTFPTVPVILLGHSMGSFFARSYAARYPKSIDGLILSGTAGKNPLAAFGKLLALLIMKIKGARYASKLMNNMALGNYCKKIKNPKTPHDGISRDESLIVSYAGDENCNFRFKVSGYHALLGALKEVSSRAWAKKIIKDMPILMIQGSCDPVGNYGKGTQQVKKRLQNAGVKNLDYKLYEGARHEVLNETNKSEVYNDVLAFLKNNFG